MENTRWKQQFEREIQNAIQSRQRGNEGMARVCARRAANIIIGEYLSHFGYAVNAPSVIKRIEFLNGLPEAPAAIKEIAGHFLIRTDTDYKLPIEADLIAEAIWLSKHLLQNLSEHQG